MCARHCTAVGRTLRYFICNKYYRLLLFALICSGPHIHTDTVNSMWNIWVRVRVCVLCKVVRVLVCLKPAQFVYVCLCACVPVCVSMCVSVYPRVIRQWECYACCPTRPICVFAFVHLWMAYGFQCRNHSTDWNWPMAHLHQFHIHSNNSQISYCILLFVLFASIKSAYIPYAQF